MRLVITGSPGTGKTAIAKRLARRLKCRAVSEQDLALEKSIGKWDHENAELVIPLKGLKREASKLLARNKDIILEGHVLCEIRLPADAVIVVRVHPEILEARLEAKGYKAEKIQDNVFCEGIDYCKKHALRKYGKRKVLEIRNEKGIKETLSNILMELKERSLIG